MKTIIAKLRKLWRIHPLRVMAASVIVVIVAVAAWHSANIGKWLTDHRDVVELSSGILGFIAFGFTAKSVLESRKITESLSTRFIGRFPAPLDVITDLISKATRSIDALWDGVDPGSYFWPEAHERLTNELIESRKKSRDVAVRFMVWGGPKAISAASGSREKDFTSERAKQYCEFHSGRNGFIKELGDEFAKTALASGSASVIKIKRKNCEDGNTNVTEVGLSAIRECLKCQKPDPKSPVFEALQLCLHQWIKTKLEREEVQISNPKETEREVAPEIFFFIIDEKEAVCVFPCPEQDALAFRTRDSNLIEMLSNIFTFRWENSRDSTPD